MKGGGFSTKDQGRGFSKDMAKETNIETYEGKTGL